MASTPPISLDRLMALARERAGLQDFGPDRFLEPLGVLVRAMNEEAQLSPRGAAAQTERLVNALANRLRKQALLARHPEIRDQRVLVAAAIVGLPRTGSTMLHRLLGASPQLTATYWWETIYPLPLEGEARGETSERRAMAKRLSRQITQAAKDFESIHPMDADAHDEELPLIEQTFVSNMPESMMYVPSYGRWMSQTDPTWAYEELIDYLKVLQWQSPGRNQRKWVLKSPTHLQFMPTLLKLFPEAVIVMTHREIPQLMGSWYSMTEALRGADSDADLGHAQAEHWTHRWRDSLRTMMEARAGAEARFVDVHYSALLKAPLEVAREVFSKTGLTFTPADAAALQGWIDANPRDRRPSHKYALEDFGVTPERLADDFAFYHVPA